MMARGDAGETLIVALAASSACAAARLARTALDR